MNTLQTLLDNNICFSVVKSTTTALIGKFFASNYFVVILRKDHDKALKLPFCKTKDYDDVFECDLDKDEIQYFKDNLELFTEKVIPKEGKVFELKNNSFKQHYELHHQN